MHYVQIILTGIFAGSVYAIGGTGIVLTYKATGVFNLAHFTIGLFAAYVLWQMNGVWGIPLWFAAPFVLLVVGPGIGVLLERFVFRSLQRRRASTSEKLVANLGVLVLFLGLINIIWGAGVKGNRKEPVPQLWPNHRFDVAGLTFDTKQLAYLISVLLVGAALYVLLRFTFLGTKIQAVVDRRELAELSTIDANRVAMVAWAIGCGLAALTGVLQAPPVLEPIRIIFFGIEMIGVAVVARLTSLPIAIASGVLLFGATHDLLDSFDPFKGTLGDYYHQLVGNWSVVLLFIALVGYRKLDELGESVPTGQGIVAADIGRRHGLRPSTVIGVVAVAAAALALPLFLSDINMTYAQQMVGLLVIFTSIVCITGFSGHISLGQASIAGLGAYFTARAVNSLHVPVIVGMVIGAGVAMLAGLIAGFPALKRKGLFLGLTTLGLGLLIDRLVFNSDLFAGSGTTGLVVHRPTFLKWDLQSQKAYYFFALVVAALCLLLANNLRSGRLGRILGAMRDSETAAKAIGIDLRRYKLFIFAASSFIAGLGGALLSMADRAWDPSRFNPVFSLFWFVAITVAGISSLGGAVLAAVIFVMLPLVIGQDIQASVFFLGIGALFLGRLPGGLIGLVRRIPGWITTSARAEYARAEQARRQPPPEPTRLQPSAFARAVLGRSNGHGVSAKEVVK
ncbi:MAG: branched-chain amino acid transport system permease protein livM [Pseudonocardiales bacterium]|nr:branched-chain amino acid transport system permease protein livM [Pseudonocardiales bacterium]